MGPGGAQKLGRLVLHGAALPQPSRQTWSQVVRHCVHWPRHLTNDCHGLWKVAQRRAAGILKRRTHCLIWLESCFYLI